MQVVYCVMGVSRVEIQPSLCLPSPVAMVENFYLKREQVQLTNAPVTQVAAPRDGRQCPQSKLQAECVGGRRYQVQREARQESG